MISIIIPSYGRASKIRGVIENICANTYTPHEIMVVVEEDQWDEYEAALLDGYPDPHVQLLVNDRKGYAGAVNTAARWAAADYLFLGADDLRFHEWWDSRALSTMNALETVKVVGTNDLWNKFVREGTHATHCLVDKLYVDNIGGVVDGPPGQVLYEGYDHNYVDTEFIGTAKARAVFAPCLSSVVEHLHFTSGKSEKDDTYVKGYAHIQEDSTLYMSRRELWWNVSR